MRRTPDPTPAAAPGERTGPNLVEIAHTQYYGGKDPGAAAINPAGIPAAKKGD